MIDLLIIAFLILSSVFRIILSVDTVVEGMQRWVRQGTLVTDLNFTLRTLLAFTAPLLTIRPLELLVITNDRLGVVTSGVGNMCAVEPSVCLRQHI